MKTKFTKGEWHTTGLEIRDRKGVIIGQAHKHLAINMPINEQQANAKLMAAAPELLKACIEASKFICTGEPVYDAIEMAIKKATE